MAIIFNESLIAIGVEAENNEAVLRMMARKLYSQGIVSHQYEEAIVKRERFFPTGLNTKSFSVAIPHADAEFVRKNAICLSVLKTPVPFELMGQTGQQTNVKLVFMLAIEEPHTQLDMLQKLMALFRDEKTLMRLAAAQEKSILEKLLLEKLELS